MNTLPIESIVVGLSKKVNNSFVKLLLYICITVIFFSDWLYFVFGIGSRYISWVPEIFSMFLTVYIPAVMSINKEWRLPAKYTILLIIYIMQILIGYAINSVAIGPMIVGTRQYLRFIPIFILPAVIHFENKDMKKLLKLLLLLALIQFPVTIWQRYFLYAGIKSGDPIGGTLGANTSGVLSIYLVMVLSFITGFYLKKEIKLRHFTMLCILIFIPTTLNETKITLLLLPIAFLIPAFLSKGGLVRTPSKIFNLCIVLSFTVLLFISIYDSFSNRNIIQFYTKKDKVESYSEKRIVPILTALNKVVSGGMKTIICGYGAGNVSVSYSKNLESKHLKEFAAYHPDNVTITKFLWETGFAGTFLFFLLIFLILFDSLKCSKNAGFTGAIAIGLAASTIIFIISLFYTKTLSQNLFMYNYIFISGFLISLKNNAKSNNTVLPTNTFISK